MGRKAAYTSEQLAEDIDAGLKLQQMADKYGVDISNISRAVKKLKEKAADFIVDNYEKTGQTFPSETALVPKFSPAPRSTSRPAKDGMPAEIDELSMWETKKALDDNYAGVRELLDKRRHPFVDAKTLLRVRAELRSHIMDGVRIMETLYAIQEQAAFQALVFEVLDEFDPAARERILERMRERRALRKACSPDRGTLRPDGDRG